MKLGRRLCHYRVVAWLLLQLVAVEGLRLRLRVDNCTAGGVTTRVSLSIDSGVELILLLRGQPLLLMQWQRDLNIFLVFQMGPQCRCLHLGHLLDRHLQRFQRCHLLLLLY